MGMGMGMGMLAPLVQATVNDQELTKPTPSASAWTRALLKRCTVQWCTWKDMVCYSENQGAKHVANAVVAESASLTQNMRIMHLKTRVSDSTHSTQWDQLKTAPPKSTVQKWMEPMPIVAWTWALLGTGTKGGAGIIPVSSIQVVLGRWLLKVDKQKRMNRETEGAHYCNTLILAFPRLTTPGSHRFGRGFSSSGGERKMACMHHCPRTNTAHPICASICSVQETAHNSTACSVADCVEKVWL